MQVLKTFTPDTFPLKEYIIDVNSNVKAPPYLNEYSVFNLSRLTLPLTEQDEEELERKLRFSAVAAKCKAVRMLDDKTWPEAVDLGLDEAQYAALKAALTQQFAIIQGPPGKYTRNLCSY